MKKITGTRFIFVCLFLIAPFCLKAQTCYLKRIIEADGDTISISYDVNNHITSIGNYSVAKTNSSGHITEIIHKWSTESSISKETYIYDQNNNVIQYDQFVGSNTVPDFITKFTYNSFHQLSESQSAVRAGQNYFYGYRIFSYPNTTTKNPSVIKTYDGDAHGKNGAVDETITLTYDDKKTIGYPNPLDDLSPFTTNNVLTATVNAAGAKPKTETFVYQYNELGYPISKTEREGGKTYVTNYSYNCK